MKKIGATALVTMILMLATSLPSDARGRGGHGGHVGYRGGHGGHGGHGHHHGHYHYGWWGPGFIGGLALGTALAYPWYAYPYPSYAYSPPVAAPPVVYQQMPAASPAVQREVAYPHGKYVLHGDGVSQPWQWIWVAAPGAAPPPPPTQ